MASEYFRITGMKDVLQVHSFQMRSAAPSESPRAFGTRPPSESSSRASETIRQPETSVPYGGIPSLSLTDEMRKGFESLRMDMDRQLPGEGREADPILGLVRILDSLVDADMDLLLQLDTALERIYRTLEDIPEKNYPRLTSLTAWLQEIHGYLANRVQLR